MPCWSNTSFTSGSNLRRSGRKNHRIEFFSALADEYDAIGREAIKATTYLDRAVLDFCDRADIDQRHAPVFLDHLPRAFGCAAQSQLFDIADRKPQHRRVDDIDKPRGQTPIKNCP